MLVKGVRGILQDESLLFLILAAELLVFILLCLHDHQQYDCLRNLMVLCPHQIPKVSTRSLSNLAASPQAQGSPSPSIALTDYMWQVSHPKKCPSSFRAPPLFDHTPKVCFLLLSDYEPSLAQAIQKTSRPSRGLKPQSM